MAVLIILTGKHQGKRLTLPEGEVVFGRDETCQVRLATNEVSRFHCRVRCAADSVVVTDIDSRNGTLINDVPIQGETELHPGDTLRVGPVAFQLVGKKVTGPASTVQASTAPASSAKKKPSDDSIMDWLADEEGESQAGDTREMPVYTRRDRTADEEGESQAGDTTIVPGKPAPARHAAAPAPETPLPLHRKFKTIGEEGEDIIQRHFELVQGGKLPKRVPALLAPQIDSSTTD